MEVLLLLEFHELSLLISHRCLHLRLPLSLSLHFFIFLFLELPEGSSPSWLFPASSYYIFPPFFVAWRPEAPLALFIFFS